MKREKRNSAITMYATPLLKKAIFWFAVIFLSESSQ
jgi:hypothetical protein